MVAAPADAPQARWPTLGSPRRRNAGPPEVTAPALKPLISLARRRPHDACRRSRAVNELVEYIAKALVDHPEQVRVTRVEGTHSILLELHVAPEDRGRVIGKQGRIVEAVRVLLAIAVARGGKRVTLVVV